MNYWQLRANERHGSLRENHQKLLTGNANAPYQYRIGVDIVAEVLRRFTKQPYWRIIAYVNACALAIALWAIHHIEDRLFAAELRRRHPERAMLTVALLAYYLFWTINWFPYPQTLPTVACLSLSSLLLLDIAVDSRTAVTWLRVVSLVFFALAQSFLRSEAVVALYVGLLIYVVFATRRWGGQSSFDVHRRVYLPIVACIALAIAALVQVYLMWVVYPQASYGTTSPVQLLLNYNSMRLFALGVFVLPWVLTLAGIRNVAVAENPAAELLAAILCASVIQFAMWIVFGRAHEVRIFVPFAMLLAPLTSMTLLERHEKAPTVACPESEVG